MTRGAETEDLTVLYKRHVKALCAMVTMKRFFVKKLALPLISLMVVTVFMLQACVSFCPWRSSSFFSFFRSLLSPPTLWPFIDYPMYSGAHYEGDAVPRLFVFGTLEDSTEVPIVAADLGLSDWHFRRHFINGLASGNDERIKEFVGLYGNRHTKRLVGLRLENHPVILSRAGLRSGPPEVQKNLRLQPPEKEN